MAGRQQHFCFHRGVVARHTLKTHGTYLPETVKKHLETFRTTICLDKTVGKDIVCLDFKCLEGFILKKEEKKVKA